MAYSGSTLTAELNRLANGGATYPVQGTWLDAQGAANKWAGTSGLALVGALNVKAASSQDNYLDLAGVCNKLAGTSGLSAVAALRLVAS